MSVILSNIIQNTTNINDEVIAGTMLASAKSGADAYLNATMVSTTPELRALYSASLNQVVGGHSALTELTVNKGWAKPYNPPTQQLSEIVSKSETTV
ncbi:spore coat protein [Clostridium ihumii]|uniref:spore coat protein n=1 Tax=Clostridium ihumii TaxID=1470356 RepID=UPI003D3581C4